MTAKRKGMTLAEAIIEQDKIFERLKAEEEAGRIANAEYWRRIHETSLTCEHRETRQWIEASEFWLCVCPACAALLIDALCEVR